MAPGHDTVRGYGRTSLTLRLARERAVDVRSVNCSERTSTARARSCGIHLSRVALLETRTQSVRGGVSPMLAVVLGRDIVARSSIVWA